MKSYKLIIFLILILFFKTGNVLSNTNIFNVNNIEIEKKGKTNNEALANKAIEKGFKELLNKILLKEDSKKLKELKLSEIKGLVTYYKVSSKKNENNVEKINYDISFNKDKIHDLFYKKSISYSEITNKDLFILPILKKNNQLFVYNNNFFYDKWNDIYNIELIDFNLLSENIEIIQKVNSNKNNLLNLELSNLFKEYSNKNLALVLIEDTNSKEEKIYFKAKILNKNIIKNINIKRLNLNEKEFYEKIITNVKQEITDLIKLQNLIDIKAPLFLNVKIKINNNNNLVELNSRFKKIDLIEEIYVQEFNNKNIYIKIKFLGKLDKIIRQLKEEKVILELINDEWSIRII